jgi:hypothetical protein
VRAVGGYSVHSGGILPAGNDIAGGMQGGIGHGPAEVWHSVSEKQFYTCNAGARNEPR